MADDQLGSLAAQDGYVPDAFEAAAKRLRYNVGVPSRYQEPAAGPPGAIDTFLSGVPAGVLGALAEHGRWGTTAPFAELNPPETDVMPAEDVHQAIATASSGLPSQSIFPQPYGDPASRFGTTTGRMVATPANLWGPGSLPAKTAWNVASGLASEAGGQLYEGTKGEKVARMLGAWGPAVAERAITLGYPMVPQGAGALGGKLPQPTFQRADVLGSIASPVVRRRPYADINSPVNAGYDAPANPAIQTVTDPQRMMFPKIYANPRATVAEAKAAYGEESPNLMRLFGVNREDLRDISRSRGPGTLEPNYIMAANPKNNSYAALNVMNDKNAQRLTDTMGLALQDPKLSNTLGWYMMDPLYHDFVKHYGPELAPKEYWNFINYKGMASPAADVNTEIARGTAANWLAKQGRFEDFVKYGGVPAEKRSTTPGFPEDMMYLPGHAYHSTSQAIPMQSYRDRGEVYASSSPKVTTYLTSHGTPEVGYQMTYPVQDSHIGRSTGFADTRTSGPKSVGSELSMTEYMTHLPWYREKVAAPLGLYAGQAQPLQWSVYGPATGVESKIGAPKLELLSDQIVKAAHRLGVSPETAKDLMIAGKAGAGLVLAAPALGDLARQDNYQ